MGDEKLPILCLKALRNIILLENAGVNPEDAAEIAADLLIAEEEAKKTENSNNKNE